MSPVLVCKHGIFASMPIQWIVLNNLSTTEGEANNCFSSIAYVIIIAKTTCFIPVLRACNLSNLHE